MNNSWKNEVCNYTIITFLKNLNNVLFIHLYYFNSLPNYFTKLIISSYGWDTYYKKRNAIIKYLIIRRKISLQNKLLSPKNKERQNFRTDTKQHLAYIFVYEVCTRDWKVIRQNRRGEKASCFRFVRGR